MVRSVLFLLGLSLAPTFGDFLCVQEMVDFLVDVWEQEGLYESR
jgi:hypothetical protein